MSGSASCETCVPNWLTVSADQSLRKSECRQSPLRGQPSQRLALLVERHRERVRRAARGLGGEEVVDQTFEAPLQANLVAVHEPGLGKAEPHGLG